MFRVFYYKMRNNVNIQFMNISTEISLNYGQMNETGEVSCIKLIYMFMFIIFVGLYKPTK